MKSLNQKIEEELLSSLNDVQKEAVLHESGPLLILAGAGSGKTRVITHRIGYLCRIRNVAPYHIAAVTFTNKAAAEMRSRLEGLIGPMAESVFVRTFHSLGLHILRRHGDRIGLKSSFTIYDDTAQKTLLKRLLKERKIEPSFLDAPAVSNEINRARDLLIGPQEFQTGNDIYKTEIRDIYAAYIRALRENNAVDFADLICESVNLLRTDQEVLDHYRNLWRHLMIDEYQDTNHAQYVLGRLIAQEHKNITVVGDDDQSIYSWRGADIENILNFEKDYPECKILRLEENYRSTTPILKTASTIIAKNERRREKTLFTGREGGEPVEYRIYENDMEEVQGILSRIRSLKGRGYRLSDNAIFYRTNAQSRIFEQLLRQERVPYVLLGGFRFFDRKEVKDLVAYLSVVVNPEDTVSLERIINVPVRGIGETGLERLRNLAFENGYGLIEAMENCDSLKNFRGKENVKRVAKLFRKWIEASKTGELPSVISRTIMKESGYEDSLKKDLNPENASRLENLQEFINTVIEYEESFSGEGKPQLEEFLQNISLLTSESNPEGAGLEDAVILMTLHNAKGLEFPIVHISGLEEGLIPHSLSTEEGGLEEERRLFYVGITRAKDQLFLSSSRYRRVFGQIQPRLESRFIEELDPDHCEFHGMTKARNASAPRASDGVRTKVPPSQRNTESYSPGERVEHAKYGEGIVVEMENTIAGQKIAIEFDSDGVTRNFLTAYTPLRKIRGA